MAAFKRLWKALACVFCRTRKEKCRSRSPSAWKTNRIRACSVGERNDDLVRTSVLGERLSFAFFTVLYFLFFVFLYFISKNENTLPVPDRVK